MDTGWHRSRGEVAGHELKQCHLGRCVLHGHTIRLELESRIASNIEPVVGVGEKRFFWVVQMRIENLLREGEWSCFA